MILKKVRTELVRIGVWPPRAEDQRLSRRFKTFRNRVLAVAGVFLTVGLLAGISPEILVVDVLVASWLILHCRSLRPESHEHPPRFRLIWHYRGDLSGSEAARVDDLLAALALQCHHGERVALSDRERVELDSLKAGSQQTVLLRTEVRGEPVTARLERLS